MRGRLPPGAVFFMPMQTYRQFFFDFDSTLVRVETLDELVADAALRRDIEALTSASMNGDASFAHVFPRKLALINPTRRALADLSERCVREWITLGAEDLIRAIHAAGKDAWIVTANFHELVDPVARHLGIPAERVIANAMRFDAAGTFAGCDDSPLMTDGGKAAAIRPFVRVREEAMMVGDSTSDLACKPEVGLFVGFGGVVVRPAVRLAADVYVERPDLRELRSYV